MTKKKFYPETKGNPNLPEIEEKIIEYWKDNDTFNRSVEGRDKTAEWVFYDGPPFANGLPHYGHLLTSSVKDIFARYHTMKGKRVERRFGWDCHGLPAEMETEKEIKVSGRAAIEEYGVEKFNDHCRTSVMKYTGIWQDYINRAARWVDFENDYKTMDKDYMESVLWAFSELYKKGLIYESHRVMPYSWAAETPLSNFETRMDDAYRDRTDKAVTVAFELEDAPEIVKKFDISHIDVEKITQLYICAWTTTPWTLPSNLALAVGEGIEYECCAYLKGGKCYIVASGEKHFDILDKARVDNTESMSIRRIKGSSLVGLKYKPLFPYFADTPNAFRILAGDFIEEGSGTGIVHLAPGFGEDDQRICADNGIEILCPVDDSGKFTDEIYDLFANSPCHSERSLATSEESHNISRDPSGKTLQDDISPQGGSKILLSLKGLNVICDTNKSDDEPYTDKQLEKNGLVNLRIINYLKLIGALVGDPQEYTHSYPHCWRTDTPLIYKAVPSWYVEVTKFRDRMVELNQEINWIPDHIKDGQFGKWLENARDWSISRNRFWGCPIPVWRTPSGKIKVFGSIKELEEFFEVKVPDLHKPFIDTLTKEVDGEIYTRVSDVFDCWFESGSMPFAQVHYPFENEQWFEEHSPADFIVEYVGQTRGWFYTLVVLSTALFDRIPFKNCICHGVILDTTGKKLSKKLRNYPDPNDMFNLYGADAMRWRMIKEPVMHGGNLLVSKDGNDIKDVVRLTIKPIWNAYHFFTLYANMDGVKAELITDSDNLMDRYILNKTKLAVEQIDICLSGFDTPNACSVVDELFEVLNNWYIRRNRDRYWRSSEGGIDGDKQAAYDTLYTVLVTMCKAAAPLLPLTTEEIYQGLTGNESVHLEEYPSESIFPEYPEMLIAMDKIRNICNAGLGVRNQENIRIRQPLQTCTIYGNDLNELEQFVNLVKDELNIKNIELSSNLESIATLTCKINFKVAGKRLGAKMKEVAAAAKQGNWKDLGEGKAEVAGEILEGDEFEIKLEAKAGIKGAQALSTNDALIVLDLEITDDLAKEGTARDVVRMIQQARKNADLNPADHINLTVKCSDSVKKAVEENKEYVCKQTLTNSLEFAEPSLTHKSTSQIEGGDVTISFEICTLP